METFQTFDAAEPVDPSAETVINAAPYVPQKASQGGVGFLDADAEGCVSDIRRQLTAAAERYLAAQRDTVGG